MNHFLRRLIASPLILLSAQIPALSQNALPPTPASQPKPSTAKPQLQRRSCPKDVETLAALLIRDLPNYANRAIQRDRSRTKTSGFPISVILAGHPEFNPLSLGPGPYTPSGNPTSTANPRQVFLTTLERDYTTNKAIELQQYHWLFLTQTLDGWRLVTMFSQLGSYPPRGTPPSPPQESSNSFIGQAVRTWLADCRAGEVRR